MIIGCTAMGNEKARFSVFAGLSFFSASIIDEKMMEVLDELAKQNTVSRKNGTIGRIGRTIPIQPIPKEIQPTIKNSNLFKLISASPIFFFLS